MERLLTRAGLLFSALALSASLATAAPARAKHHAAAALKCPACHMTLSTKKTASTPRAVKIHGKTYYCCAACDMSHVGASGVHHPK